MLILNHKFMNMSLAKMVLLYTLQWENNARYPRFCVSDMS